MSTSTTCPTTKRRYPTYTEAKTVLKLAKRRKHPGLMPPVRCYRCEVCGDYHLSSTKERKAS